MTKIYGINNCDTIKKTLNWFRENDIAFEFHDYRKQGISPSLVNEFLEHFDLDVIINRRGTTWRKLPETTRNDLSLEQAKKLMCSQPALIKRPIINSNGHWLIGFERSSLESLIGKK